MSLYNAFVEEAGQTKELITDNEALALWWRMQQALRAAGQVFSWDDLRFPITTVRKGSGGAEPADVSYKGGIVLNFTNTATKTIYFIVQMSHGYYEGTDISLHLHYAPTNTNTGNIVWQATHSWANVNDVWPAPSTINLTRAAPGVTNQHTKASFSTLSGTEKTLSSVLICSLSRLGADGSDTFTGNAYVVTSDIHFKMDTTGSQKEFTKL